MRLQALMMTRWYLSSHPSKLSQIEHEVIKTFVAITLGYTEVMQVIVNSLHSHVHLYYSFWLTERMLMYLPHLCCSLH